MNIYGKALAWSLVLILHSSVLWKCSSELTRKAETAEAQKADRDWRYIEQDQALKSFTGNGLACKSKYRGIGVRINWVSNEVIEVAPGGPASQAGVLVGDILLNEGMFYEPIGTVVKINVRRKGVEMTLEAKVDDICSEQ